MGHSDFVKSCFSLHDEYSGIDFPALKIEVKEIRASKNCHVEKWQWDKSEFLYIFDYHIQRLIIFKITEFMNYCLDNRRTPNPSSLSEKSIQRIAYSNLSERWVRVVPISDLEEGLKLPLKECYEAAINENE